MDALASHRTLITPGYRTLIVHDVDADAYADDAFAEYARLHPDRVASGSGYHLWLFSRQDVVRVGVEIQVWAGEPEDEPGWDGTARFLLHCETGDVAVRNLHGDVAGLWRLPCTGTQAARVRWRGRQRSAEAADRVFEQASRQGWSAELRDEALAALNGAEEYRIDLWPSARPLPDEEY